MSAYASADQTVRGLGVGIELDDTSIRAVLVTPDAPGRVARVASFDLEGGSTAQILDGLTRVALELGVLHQSIPTRISWHTHNSTIQSVDLTGRDRSAWSRIRHEAIGEADATGSIIVTAGARTVLQLVTWDELRANALAESAAAAGLGVVSIEPAPFAATRVCPPETTFVRRGNAHGHWSATMNDGVIGLYGTVESGGGGRQPTWQLIREPSTPGMGLADSSSNFHPPTHYLQVGRTLAHLEDQLVDVPACPRSDSIDLVGDLYPDYPPEEPNSVENVAIALGAALGAAGLHTRWRILERNFEVSREVPAWTLPWSLEPLDDSDGQDWVVPDQQTSRRRLFGRASQD